MNIAFPHAPATRARHTGAFTLIELLIVVAIIAILAAIAVPNFLEAQTRAKVSRAKADIASLATALETYRLDHNAYPPNNVQVFTGAPTSLMEARHAFLTTPVAYITSIPDDPFGDRVNVSDYTGLFGEKRYRTYDLLQFEDPASFESLVYKSELVVIHGYPQGMLWLTASQGPDGTVGLNTAIGLVYDPTNGTTSAGDVLRTGPGGDLRGG